VGTSSALSNISYETTSILSPKIQLVGSDASTAHLGVVRTSGGGPADLTLGWGSSGNIAASNQEIAAVLFSAFDGTAYKNAAYIQCRADDTHASGDTPGRLEFSTTADGSASPTERMRITKEGYVYFNTTVIPSASGYGSAFVELGSAGSNTRRTGLYQRSETTNASSIQAYYNPNGIVGSISISGSSTVYNTSSDYRLKENIVPLTGAADRLNQLQVHRFNFIADPDTTVDGFLAHEAQAVVPECVTGTKDEVDDEGNPVYQGIDQSKLVPLLTAALQEAIGRIETLETRLTALEGGAS
jgi:hypothetical protein